MHFFRRTRRLNQRKRAAALRKAARIPMKLEAMEPRLLLSGTNPVNTPLELVPQFLTTNAVENLLNVEMTSAVGAPGGASGWDLLDVNSTLSMDNSTDRSDLYTIRLKNDGTSISFDPENSYRWKIIEANAIDADFDIHKVRVDTVDFAPARDTDGNPLFLLRGKFDLEKSGNDIYLNYIAGVRNSEVASATWGQNQEYLFNINDFQDETSQHTYNYQTDTDGNVSSGEEEFFGANTLHVTGTLQINSSSANPFTIRARSLSTSKNCITVEGAGLFGPLHNFNFSEEAEWTVVEAETITGVSDTAELREKVVVDKANFFGDAKYVDTQGDLNLYLIDNKIVLKYEPLSTTRNSNVALGTVHTIRTGDVARIDLSVFDIFSGATEFIYNILFVLPIRWEGWVPPQIQSMHL
jgi:hypothetical protein